MDTEIPSPPARPKRQVGLGLFSLLHCAVVALITNALLGIGALGGIAPAKTLSPWGAWGAVVIVVGLAMYSVCRYAINAYNIQDARHVTWVESVLKFAQDGDRVHAKTADSLQRFEQALEARASALATREAVLAHKAAEVDSFYSDAKAQLTRVEKWSSESTFWTSDVIGGHVIQTGTSALVVEVRIAAGQAPARVFLTNGVTEWDFTEHAAIRSPRQSIDASTYFFRADEIIATALKSDGVLFASMDGGNVEGTQRCVVAIPADVASRLLPRPHGIDTTSRTAVTGGEKAAGD